MSTTGFIILFGIIYADLAVLKQRNKELFQQVFYFSPVVLNLFTLLTLCLVLFSSESIQTFDALTILGLCGLTPIYLIRRSRFIASLEKDTLNIQGHEPRDDESINLTLLSDALGLGLLWMLSALVIDLVTDTLISPLAKNTDFIKILVSSALSSAVIFWMIFKTAKNRSPQNYKQDLGLVRKKPFWLKVLLVPVAAGLGFAFLSSYLIETRPIQPDTPLSDLMSTVDQPWMVIVFLMLAIVIAPFVEELAFRGYFFHVLSRIWGTNPAIVAVSFIFAFLHVSQYWGDWLAIGMVALLGVALTLLRVWSGSTWASITMHYVYNFGATLIPIIMLTLSNPAYFKYQIYFDRLDNQTKETLLLESIQKDPDLAEAYNDLAWLYADQNKNLPQALKLINKALTYDEDNEAFLDTKAYVLEKMHKSEEVRQIRQFIDQLKKADRLDQENFLDSD